MSTGHASFHRSSAEPEAKEPRQPAALHEAGPGPDQGSRQQLDQGPQRLGRRERRDHLDPDQGDRRAETPPRAAAAADAIGFSCRATRNSMPATAFAKPAQGGQGEGGKEATDRGEGEDEFQFALSREEFLDLFFEDLELPGPDQDEPEGDLYLQAAQRPASPPPARRPTSTSCKHHAQQLRAPHCAQAADQRRGERPATARSSSWRPGQT